MLIRLQKYDLVVQYKRGSRMFLADIFIFPHGGQIESESETINMMNYLPISEARYSLLCERQNKMRRFRF